MHHENHTTGGGCPKCVINTRQIAVLAQLMLLDMNNAAVERLAMVANAADKLYSMQPLSLLERPKPCEHAVKLMQLIRADDLTKADQDLLDQWADEILDDVEELVTGGR